MVREALQTWQRLRGTRRMPSRADMTPRAMKGFLKYMTLAQALDGGRNFYFRVSGYQVNIQQGIVLQGHTTDDIDARIPGFGSQLARLYARAMRRREVCAYRGLYFRPGDKHTFSHESIMAPLGDDGEDPGADQPGHVAVQAGRGDVGQLGGQGAGGERPVTEEGLHDPQPDRVQQEVSGRHAAHSS